MLVRPYDQPWSTNYEKQQADALDRATGMSAEQLRSLGPPLPQIQYLPPRFGYPSYVDRQWSVMQVFGIDRLPSGQIPGMPQMRGEDRVDYSRFQGGGAGSDRNTNSGDPLGLGGGGM